MNWCNVHKRQATYLEAGGNAHCDPNLGGILMPCQVVEVKVPTPEEAVELCQRVVVLEARLEEVHSWAVCAPIATDADMMQNINRIVEITEKEVPKC
jgi:hypothetical protein